jgi:diadenosine tetraphosphate (Ap4A) HIT family hydrolase
MKAAIACPLCEQDGGEVLWRNTQLRVVHTDDEALYSGICRVIWDAHVGEFSDLTTTQRHMLMDVVSCVEQVSTNENESSQFGESGPSSALASYSTVFR